jgi:hypothetical protein
MGLAWECRPRRDDLVALPPTVGTPQREPAVGPTFSTIRRMLDAGMSRLAIASELNASGMPTARGGAWTSASVGNILKRAT